MCPIRDVGRSRGRTIQKDFRTANSGEMFWDGNDRRSSLAGRLRARWQFQESQHGPNENRQMAGPKDELCVDVGPGADSGCYEVWISGNAVELRPTGLGLPLQGVLQKLDNAD